MKAHCGIYFGLLSLLLLPSCAVLEWLESAVVEKAAREVVQSEGKQLPIEIKGGTKKTVGGISPKNTNANAKSWERNDRSNNVSNRGTDIPSRTQRREERCVYRKRAGQYRKICE